MCNDYEQHVAWAEYCKMMQSLALSIPARQATQEVREVHGDCSGEAERPTRSRTLGCATRGWKERRNCAGD
jgi:hypothetical protein